MVNLVVRTSVKELVVSSKYEVQSMSSDFMDKLDEKVKELVEDACRRAKENSRRTVMPRDL